MLCQIIIASFHIFNISFSHCFVSINIITSILEISALPKINYSIFIVSYVIREPEFIAK